MRDLYRPADGRRVALPGGNEAWPISGLPADFSNPYVARLVRDGDLVKVPNAPRKGKKPAGDDA